MTEETRNNKDNLIIGLLIQIQAEVQTTRDVTLGMLTEALNLNDEQVERLEKKYQESLKESQMTIVGDIKHNYISKNQSINDLLNQVFPENG